MIKVNDLRIGNYILFKQYGEGDGKIGAMKPGDFGRFNNEEYFSIPLTPELLEACGFTNHKRNVTFGVSGFYSDAFWAIVDGLDEFNQRIFRHAFSLQWFEDGAYFQMNHRSKGIKIENLHHLQNIYYYNTGHELEIKTLTI